METLENRSVDGSESTSSQWELELQASMEKLNTFTFKNNDCNLPQNSLNHQTSFDVINQSPKINFRQSLTQSPINSILNRSKIAIRNSLSKSLNNSPVNIGFNFAKTNLIYKNSENLLTNNSKPINSSKNDNFNCQSISILNNQNHTTENDNNHQYNDNSVPTNDLLNENKMSFSAETSPIKFKSPTFKKSNAKMSSVKELPLLSMFQSPASTQISKNKSCSMINLAEKRNLKTLLDNSELVNIQAVSIERLANARSSLMAEHGDGRVELPKK